VANAVGLVNGAHNRLQAFAARRSAVVDALPGGLVTAPALKNKQLWHSTLEMTNLQRPGVLQTGTRTATDQGKWTYGVAPGTGGRLVVWLSGTAILATKTLYGSGVPVTESTRGELRDN